MFLSRFNPGFLIRLLVVCLLFGSGHALANSRDGGGSSERREEQRARISAAEAASIVERRYGGKVMGVQTRQGGSGIIYSVKILQSSGHMRTVNVDGQTGAILN